MKRLAMAVSIGVALAATACGGSQGGGGPVEARAGTVGGGAADLWVTSGDDVLPVYEADGRSYLLGEQGRSYSIWVANRTGGRIEAVVSVDGRDAVSGRRADFRRDRGYVLESGEELRIDGFRRSLDEVAEFEFAPPGESYAERMGDGSSIGVIGLAIFDEDEDRPRPVPIAGGDDDGDRPRGEDREYGARTQAAPSPGLAKAGGATAMESEMAADEPGLGTKYGRDLGSEAEIVPFKRKDPEQPLEIIALYYDDRRGLERRGVIFPDPPRPDLCSGPNPFPDVPCDEGFAPPPPPVY
jgi:hypothetical protein